MGGAPSSTAPTADASAAPSGGASFNGDALEALASVSSTSARAAPFTRSDSFDPLSSNFKANEAAAAASPTAVSSAAAPIEFAVTETVNAQFVGAVLQTANVEGTISVATSYGALSWLGCSVAANGR